MDQTASLDVLTSTSACSILSATPSKKKKSKYQSTRLKEKEDDDELHLVCVWKKKKKKSLPFISLFGTTGAKCISADLPTFG